jgi:type II secretory pathway pseudopilin PulG
VRFQKRLFSVAGTLRQEAGTTLVEVLVACGLTVLLFAAVFSMLISSMKSVTLQTDQIDAQQQAQLALSRMEREMRQAQKPFLWQALVPGSYETIIFKADLNNDGTAEAIRYEYQLSTGQLSRQINTTGALDFDTAPRDLLAKYVVNSATQRVFTYYGTDLTTPLDPSNPLSDIINKTRFIRVRLIIDKNINKPPAAFDMATDVKLRNFQY